MTWDTFYWLHEICNVKDFLSQKYKFKGTIVVYFHVYQNAHTYTDVYKCVVRVLRYCSIFSVEAGNENHRWPTR